MEAKKNTQLKKSVEIKLKKLPPVFSIILSTTGKINFQTGRAILLPFEFSRNSKEFKMMMQGSRGGKFFRLAPEKENTVPFPAKLKNLD